MSKKIWDGEYDINTDWGGKDTGGHPLSGEMVQDVIKTEFKRLENEKVGYITESGGTVYFSSNREAYEAGNTLGSVISTQRYAMYLELSPNNREVFLSGESDKKLVWYFKTEELASKNVYEEKISVEYRIENATDNYEKTFSTILSCSSDATNSGFTEVVMNLDEYLTNGVSNIEIYIKGLSTRQERRKYTKVTIVTLDIEDATNFSVPVEEELLVQTNVNCTKGQAFYYEYRFDNDEFVFDNQSRVGEGRNILERYGVSVSGLDKGRHVFEYRLYVNIGGESVYYTATQRIEFIKGVDFVFDVPQILIFSTYFSNEEPLAEDGNLIINGVSQYVPHQVKYCVYNTNISTTNLEFTDITNGDNGAPTTASAEKGNLYYYSIQSMDSGSRTIEIVCKDLDNNVIENANRIFYVNVAKSDLKISEFKKDLRINFSSVGKTNDSNKDSWISNENGRINTATFSENFDWSQGWTKNGLVIGEGCEVFFDYAPFPQQKESSTENLYEYVGGDQGITIELEFMTQNVTNEDTVLCDMINERSTDDCGLLITGSEIRFNTPGGESVSSRFKEGDMNRAVIVVRPYSFENENNEEVFKGLVELYMNGVMTNVAKYSKSEKFEVYEWDENGNAISKRLRFTGGDGADLVIKYIRVYNTVMTPDEIVNNYIIYRDSATEMLNLYNKNNVINEQGVITPNAMLELGNIPILIFVGRTVEDELATGCGNTNGYDGGYKPGAIGANSTNWYATLEATTNKKEKVDMDVIYYNPLDKRKNFKFVKAYITPQGTSSMYYPKKNYRIYTQKNSDTRIFFSLTDEEGNLTSALELDQMLKSNFGEDEKDREYEFFRGTDKKIVKKKVYSFKDNAQAVKCWCLKADFAETSSSHNTGIAKLWGDTLKNSTVNIDNTEYNVFKTTAQATIERIYNNNVNGDMPDIRTTIDGFPIVVFGKKSYGDEYVFLGKYNFNNDKSTESVFGFCDIDNTDKSKTTDNSCDYEKNISGTTTHTLDAQLDKYMSCVETLDNGNALANFSTMSQIDASGNTISWDDAWEDAFEFRYPEIPEKPKESDYKSGNTWTDKEGYEEDLAQYEEDIVIWKNNHLKPFKHFAQWLYDTRWCDVHGNILPGLTEEEAAARKAKFAEEKWLHIDVWKMAAYYVYAMRFGAVDQIVKNSMLTSEGPFAYNQSGARYGEWDATDPNSPLYGQYYKWYYINYDNDTIMGVKNDGSLKYGPEITRQDVEGKDGNVTPIYAGSNSTLWNNIEYDEEFQDIIRIADRGISRTMTYKKAINMFDVEQVGKWCERIYNKDAEYKYISPYKAEWKYTGDDENAESFVDKLFMLQGSRTAHRRWWLSRRFNLLDGKWSSGDFASKYVEVKCDYGNIGDKFTAVAGANAYFGYQINGKTFGDAKGGVTKEYKANDAIDWELRKVINIGDPIAIYGSNDLLELNLQGLSKNLASVSFRFGSNDDLGNKLERLVLSLSESDLLSKSSYKAYGDDEIGTAGRQTGFEKLKDDYPFEINSIEDFENGTYPTVTEPFDANASNSPKFYRIESLNENGDTIYVYFAKVDKGVRNYACDSLALDALNKLQSLKVAGYMSLSSLDLSKNPFINDVDVRYSGIKNIDFGNGSRIKDLKISNETTRLSFTSCDNLRLENIHVNNTSLRLNGGKSISEIYVVDSSGLNHDENFKTFIVNWMNNGDVTSKKLILRGVHWENATVEELNTILNFIEGEKHAIECIITGTIKMGPNPIMSSDLVLFERLEKLLGGSLTIKIPYDNVIWEETTSEIIAGQTAKFKYKVFPSENPIYAITYSLVVEVTQEETIGGGPNYVSDDINRRYYRIIEDTDEIRKGIKLIDGENKHEVLIQTEEIVAGGDTTILLMVKFYPDGTPRFDVAEMVIKEPTYAIGGTINGPKNLGNKNTPYTFTLSIDSNAGGEPIGTMQIEWNVIDMDEEDPKGVDDYFIKPIISEDGRTYTLTTSNVQPYPIGRMKIVATVTNHEASESLNNVPRVVTIEKDIHLINEEVVLTKEYNEVVFNICRSQGWTSNPEVMTRAEAEAVTNIGTAFANIKAISGWTFDEFKFFTNADLTQLEEGAFANSDIVSITLPENITAIGNGAWKGCKLLNNVQLGQSIKVIPKECFYGCENLESLILPDKVEIISAFAFGGAKMEGIVEKTTEYVTRGKYIYLTSESQLKEIQNRAFEESASIINPENGTIQGTNILRIVELPKKLDINNLSYDFLLTKHLEAIRLINDAESNLSYTNNILYANNVETTLVRALPCSNGENELEEVVLPNVVTVFDYAFYGCDTIKTVIFGGNLAMLGVGTFYESNIRRIELDRCRTRFNKIYSYTFSKCPLLEEIVLPKDGNLTVFQMYVFNGCDSLKHIELPETLLEFESNQHDISNTIAACNALEELILPDSLVKSGRFIVRDCNNLKRLVLPKYYTMGVYDVVSNCKNFEELVLPLFSYTNENGEDVVINNSMANAARYSIIQSSCPIFRRYVLREEDNNKIMIEKDGILYRVGTAVNGKITPTELTLYAVPFHFTEMIVGEEIKNVDIGCFGGSPNLTKVVLSESITVIPKELFNFCSGLREVYILGNVQSIGRMAFCLCSVLSKFVILTPTAPQIESGAEENGIYPFHPFGYDEYSYTGRDTLEENTIYLPYGHTGYDAPKWEVPLFTQCSFEKKLLSLSERCVFKVFDENGEEITDNRTLYLDSDSKNLVFSFNNEPMTANYDESEGGFVIDFDDKVYHNETIYVYGNSERTELWGTFKAMYGVTLYTINRPETPMVFGMQRNISEPVEYINIRKSDYETLISRVNLLTEQMNKLRKK